MWHYSRFSLMRFKVTEPQIAKYQKKKNVKIYFQKTKQEYRTEISKIISNCASQTGRDIKNSFTDPNQQRKIE